MRSSVDDIARRAAERLGPELDRNLPAIVEAELQGGRPPERFEPLGTVIALATLIVTAAQLAWTMYRDVKKDKKAAPAPDLMARRLRLELKIDENVSAEQRDKIIAVVVDEIAKAPPEP